jgi:hypothetical protein
MLKYGKFVLLPALVLAASLLGAACETKTITQIQHDTVKVTVRDTVRIGNTTRTFDQIERLGNPLYSEVFLEKREHPHHNSSSPSEDVALFRQQLISFMTGVAGRDAGYGAAVADALTPDMLIARLDKPRSTNDANVGWLLHALDPANGFGGRKLTGDDVVDKGLSVIFGNALGNNNNVSPGLVTDNVPANDRQHSTTFPYLAGPN